MAGVEKPKFHLARHVSTRHDTFDMSSASKRACRAVLFDKLDTVKRHELDTSNVSCQDVTWRAKWLCCVTSWTWLCLSIVVYGSGGP